MTAISETEAVIVVPMLPPREVSPNFHGSWRARARAAREFRECAGWAAKEMALGDFVWCFAEHARLPFVVMDAEIAWCCGRKALDDDNAWASLKPARDGISDVLFGGEDRFIVQGKLTQTRGDGTVTVTLRQANDV